MEMPVEAPCAGTVTRNQDQGRRGGRRGQGPRRHRRGLTLLSASAPAGLRRLAGGAALVGAARLQDEGPRLRLQDAVRLVEVVEELLTSAMMPPMVPSPRSTRGDERAHVGGDVLAGGDGAARRRRRRREMRARWRRRRARRRRRCASSARSRRVAERRAARGRRDRRWPTGRARRRARAGWRWRRAGRDERAAGDEGGARPDRRCGAAGRDRRAARSASPAARRRRSSSSSSAGRFSRKSASARRRLSSERARNLSISGGSTPTRSSPPRTGGPGARAVRRRADLEVGLAEHRRRGHEELAVVAQLARPRRAPRTRSARHGCRRRSRRARAPRRAPRRRRARPAAPCRRRAARPSSPSPRAPSRRGPSARSDSISTHAIGAASATTSAAPAARRALTPRVVERRPERHLALTPSRRTSTDCASGRAPAPSGRRRSADRRAARRRCPCPCARRRRAPARRWSASRALSPTTTSSSSALCSLSRSPGPTTLVTRSTPSSAFLALAMSGSMSRWIDAESASMLASVARSCDASPTPLRIEPSRSRRLLRQRVDVAEEAPDLGLVRLAGCRRACAPPTRPTAGSRG